MGVSFDKAVETYTRLSSDQWEIGRLLMDAVDNEHRSIREFCVKVHGNHDREDSMGRWVQANRFKKEIDGLPGVEFMDDLEITWWAEAQKGYEDGWDIEEMLDTLSYAHCDNDGKRKSINLFRAERAKATGKDSLYWRKLSSMSKKVRDLRKKFDSTKHDMEIRFSSIDEVIADHTEAAYVEVASALHALERAELVLDLLSEMERDAKEEIQTA